jgi:hypothetical protein
MPATQWIIAIKSLAVGLAANDLVATCPQAWRAVRYAGQSNNGRDVQDKSSRQAAFQRLVEGANLPMKSGGQKADDKLDRVDERQRDDITVTQQTCPF